MEEEARLPYGFLDRLLEYRSFAGIYLAVTRASSKEHRQALMAHPLAELAEQIEFALQQEDIDAQAHG